MRKTFLIEIIFVVWFLLMLLLLLPTFVRAEELECACEAQQQAEQPMIAFTFDDGPDYIQTQRLLDGLAERGAKATFFVVGEKLDYKSGKGRIDENRALVKRMVDDGHIVGNHSYSHCWLNKVTKEKAAMEISKTNELIKEVTGSYPIYMRPPGGSACTSATVRKLIAPMITVCWGYYDTRDWQCRNVDKMVKMIVDNTCDGDIILMHDNYETSVDTVLQAMDILADRGYRFVTVDELLKRNAGDSFILDPDRIYCTMKPGDTSKLKAIE